MVGRVVRPKMFDVRADLGMGLKKGVGYESSIGLKSSVVSGDL